MQEFIEFEDVEGHHVFLHTNQLVAAEIKEEGAQRRIFLTTTVGNYEAIGREADHWIRLLREFCTRPSA